MVPTARRAISRASGACVAAVTPTSLAAILGMLAALLPIAAFAQEVCTTATDAVGTIAQKINQESACWSCQLYASVYTRMHTIVDASYSSLTSSTVGAPVFGITVVGIVLMVKLLPFLVGSGDALEMIAGLRMYFFRISVAFLIFLGVTSYQIMDANGLASNFFVDGPLAMGTDIGEVLSTQTTSALAAAAGGAGGGGTSLFGAPGGANPCAGITAGSGMQSFESEHCRAATTILYNLHQMGTVGILTGLWLVLEYPNLSLFSIGSGVIAILSGTVPDMDILLFHGNLLIPVRCAPEFHPPDPAAAPPPRRARARERAARGR